MTDWFRTIWYVLTLRCDEAERVRARRSIGEARRAERLGERLHSLACKSCRRARRQLGIVDRTVEELRSSLNAAAGESPASLSTDARSRIGASIAAETQKDANGS